MMTMDFDLNNWMTSKRSGEVLIEHVGDFTLSYIDSVIPTMEQKLHDSINTENVRKKAFHIFVECVQNLYHHIEPIELVQEAYGNNKMGVIVMSKDKSMCRISTGNFVPVEKTEKLKAQIDYINSFDEAGIKTLYRTTMSNKQFSDKGGAGIGMIDMARKSGNKLNGEFYTVKNHPEVMFFSQDVCINQQAAN